MRPKINPSRLRQYPPARARVPTYQVPLRLHVASRRHITADEKPLPQAEGNGAGPNETQLPHVSEEAAAIGEVTGEGGPDIEEQGTPVQEILNRDDKSKDKAPEVMKGGSQSKSSDGTRSFSTYPRRRAEVAMTEESTHSDVAQKGHIFDLPALPLPSNANLKYRYDPIVKQLTALIMRDGKLGVAQRVRSTRLRYSITYEPPRPLPSILPDL